MDVEMENLQSLDALEIIREALKILRRACKLLGSVAFSLLLPLSFAILGHRVISEPLLSKIINYNALLSTDLFGPAAESLEHSLRQQILELFLLTAVYITLIWGFSLLSTSAVVYTVASIYAGKELSYGLVLSTLPWVWKCVMHTFLWFFLMVFVYCVGTVSALFLWVFIGGVVGLNRETLVIGFIGIAIVAVSFHVYIATVWQVASVVCVVEGELWIGRRGEEQKTYQRKLGHGFGTDSFVYAAYGHNWWWPELFSVWRVEAGNECGSNCGCVVLQCGVDLVWLLSHCVLYFVCKSCQCEDIDKEALSNHLEVFHGGYMLLKDDSFWLDKFGP